MTNPTPKKLTAKGGRPTKEDSLARMRREVEEAELQLRTKTLKLKAAQAEFEALQSRKRRRLWLELGEMADQGLGLGAQDLEDIILLLGGPGDHRQAIRESLGLAPAQDDAGLAEAETAEPA